MRHIITTLFLIFVNSIVAGQIVNEETAYLDYTYNKDIIVNNKIGMITIESNFANGQKMGRHILYFDTVGKLTKQAIFDTSKQLLREFYFLTNAKNDLILRKQIDYEFNRTDTVKYFKAYQNDKIISDSSSEMPISNHYDYSKNGHLIRTTIKSNLGLGNNTRRVIQNTLDSLERTIRIVETVYQTEGDKTGRQFSFRDIYYNPNNKIEKEVEKINSANSWMANKGSITYKYDNTGNLLQYLRTNAASYYYDYNDKKLITSKQMIMNLEESKIKTIDKYTYTFRE